jgi:hypothetical protein
MPKVRTFELVVEGRPSEVAGRLRARTRPRIFDFARPLDGAGGLGGWVTDEAFRLALDPVRRGVTFRGRLQPVASGTLEADGPNRTRIRGRCALPAFIVWYFRAAWLFLVPLLLGAGWLAWSGDLTFLPFVAFFAVAVVGAALGIGLNISSAEADLEPLEQALSQLAGAAHAPRQAQREAERA